MKNSLLSVSLVVFLIACQSKSTEQRSESSAINPTEKTTDGYILLFDGKTLQGWRTYKNKPNNSWEVADGILHCKPFQDGIENFRSDLITEEQYENFELQFEWKISHQGNSGVIFRVSEDYNESFQTGPEYQVLDDENYPGDVKNEHFSGGNFGMHAPQNKILNPVGEWNNSKLIVNGNHVEHWLNGSKTVEYELYSEDWTNLKNNSKWVEFPEYATVKKGYIALQDHSSEVWYRNIKIKVLD